MKAIKSLNYEIEFVEEAYVGLNELIKGRAYSSIFILVDENTEKYCLPTFLEKLSIEQSVEIISIDSGEENKHLETCTGVWEVLSDLDADRKSLLINVGGGVVTDLGGFVASTFKRGIEFINVPTTLLSMVDASVGGKTGVDLGGIKNQIGIIVNPQKVIIDTSYLETLPVEEYKSGYAEILKHGLISDASYWKKAADLKNNTTETICELIFHSVGIKNKVVLEDLYEKNIRKILNFGHTIGHAIESYCLNTADKKRLLHGEAIGIGMILEAFISSKLKGLPMDSCDEIKKVFSGLYEKVDFNKEEITSIKELLRFDKKNSHGKINFVLLKEIGSAVVDIEVSEELIEESFQYYLEG